MMATRINNFFIAIVTALLISGKKEYVNVISIIMVDLNIRYTKYKKIYVTQVNV